MGMMDSKAEPKDGFSRLIPDGRFGYMLMIPILELCRVGKSHFVCPPTRR